MYRVTRLPIVGFFKIIMFRMIVRSIDGVSSIDWGETLGERGLLNNRKSPFLTSIPKKWILVLIVVPGVGP